MYLSFYVRMPLNTRDQGVSPAFTRIELTNADSHQRRLEILSTLQAGDLVYIPRHVMMVIGHEQGEQTPGAGELCQICIFSKAFTYSLTPDQLAVSPALRKSSFEVPFAQHHIARQSSHGYLARGLSIRSVAVSRAP